MQPFRARRRPTDGITDETPVAVTLTISRRDGEVVYSGQTTAHPEEHQFNGRGCDPTTWTAQVVASGTHNLREVGPSED